nr:DUF2637 domain-containing protein [Streptomonospora sp. PA3]
MVTRGTRPTGITAVIQWSGTAVVAAVAAVVSYGHMRDLLLSYGETALVAHILPLSVDGLLLVASVALGRRRQHPAEAAAPAPQPAAAAAVGAAEQPAAAPVWTPVAEQTPAPAGAGLAPGGLGEQARPARAAAAEPAEAGAPRKRQPRRQRPARLSAEQAAATAAELIAAADSEGRTVTGAELGERCQRSASWGRTVLREYRQRQPSPVAV